MPQIFAYIVHRGGIADESAVEMLAAARKIDPAQSPTAVVTGCGAELDSVCESLRSSYRQIWKVPAVPLIYPNAELVRKALLQVLPPAAVLLVPHGHFGVDLSPGLSIKLGASYAADVLDIEAASAGMLRIVRQEFGGQVNAHVFVDISSGAVLNLRPGAFRGESATTNGQVVDKPVDAAALTAGRRYLETIPAEAGDVDISKEAILVSIGRGIQAQENVALAEDLAAAVGGAVSCSRPVVDAKWLPKSRQVGSSGQTVRPKVYLACGMSGSFQHLAGLKGTPFIVAINKNPKAPIFRVADVGVVGDILEYLPALAGKVRDEKCVAAKGAHR